MLWNVIHNPCIGSIFCTSTVFMNKKRKKKSIWLENFTICFSMLIFKGYSLLSVKCYVKSTNMLKLNGFNVMKIESLYWSVLIEDYSSLLSVFVCRSGVLNYRCLKGSGAERSQMDNEEKNQCTNGRSCPMFFLRCPCWILGVIYFVLCYLCHIENYVYVSFNFPFFFFSPCQ